MINVLRRRDPEQRRLRRGMYLLPSLFTLANMFCGYACVVYAMRGEYATAAPLIGIAVVLDMLDGRIARMTGTVTRVVYQPGKFLPAYKAEAARDNERNEVWIDRGGQLVVCRQVVGVLARRIVCRVAAGARVTAGQRFGVMKFGSRIDVYVPPGTELRVASGARVRSGESILAVLPPVAGAGTAR